MNINRNNYETFFLLYIDNELSAAERRVVHEFVENNPDLQEELLMFQQSVLKPDEVVFDNKESLLKKDLAPTPLQEKLLRYLDGELAGEEKEEVEQSLAGNDQAIRREWETLSLAKLDAGEQIIFENKQSLYRREGGRVIAFPWRKLAAAAVLVGLGLWGTLSYLDRNKPAVETATVHPAQGKNTPAKETPAVAATIQPKVLDGQSKAPDNQSPTTGSVDQLTNTDKNIAATEPVTQKPVQVIKQPSSRKVEPKRISNDDANTVAVAGARPSNNLPAPLSENLNKVKRNTSIPSNVTNQTLAGNIENPGNNETTNTQDEVDRKNEYASTASHMEGSDANEGNRVLFMNEEKVKKTKLGGIFRRVKRVLERNTSMGSGDNNIKVANLEFAIQ